MEKFLLLGTKIRNSGIKLNKKLLTIGFFSLISSSLMAQNITSKGTLKVFVSGMENNNGKLFVNLFRKGDDIMAKPYLQYSEKIVDGKSAVNFENLPYGNYVAFAFHDENNNGSMDHNWLNIPNEPMGYSNNWNFSLFSGMPSYEKTKFHFSEQKTAIKILLE